LRLRNADTLGAIADLLSTGKRIARALPVALAVAVLLLLALGGWSLVAELTVSEASSERIHDALADVPARGTAIVLGARVYADGTLSPVLADRVRCAVALYRAGKVQRVLVSGDHGRRAYDEVNAMADALAEAGLPAAHVFRDHAGFRTLDTMHRARAVFQVRDAVICTQRFHMERAIYLARRFGVDAVGLVADRRVYEAATYNTLRERVAVASALFDSVIGRSARMLGPSHPIEGDGRTTQDRRMR
jgi:SanA protein